MKYNENEKRYLIEEGIEYADALPITEYAPMIIVGVNKHDKDNIA